MKKVLIFIMIVLSMGLVSSDLEVGFNDDDIPKVELEQPPEPPTNFSSINVNNSDFWDGLDTPADIGTSELNNDAGFITTDTNVTTKCGGEGSNFLLLSNGTCVPDTNYVDTPPGDNLTNVAFLNQSIPFEVNQIIEANLSIESELNSTTHQGGMQIVKEGINFWLYDA